MILDLSVILCPKAVCENIEPKERVCTEPHHSSNLIFIVHSRVDEAEKFFKMLFFRLDISQFSLLCS